jgi:hypothetical protein
MLRLKKCSNFLFVSNLFEGCSKCIQIALFASWNNSNIQCCFWFGCLILRIFFNLALFASWKSLELLCIGSKHKLRTIVSSTFVQDLNRAAPATFRSQIEQIWTYLEQPQIRFKTKKKNWTLFGLSLKNLDACYN